MLIETLAQEVHTDHMEAIAGMVVTICGFLTLVVQQGYKMYSDNENHRWLVEAQQQAAATALASQEKLDAHHAVELAKLDEIKAK
ncbi:MAG: hypothetical protein NVS1B11_36720 [Terriglobales bacterium]